MRTRQQLLETFNKSPRPEGVIQNQLLLLEVLCDIRDMLQEQHDIPGVKGEKFIAPWENLEHSSEPANEKKEIEQKDLNFIKKAEPI